MWIQWHRICRIFAEFKEQHQHQHQQEAHFETPYVRRSSIRTSRWCVYRLCPGTQCSKPPSLFLKLYCLEIVLKTRNNVSCAVHLQRTQKYGCRRNNSPTGWRFGTFNAIKAVQSLRLWVDLTVVSSKNSKKMPVTRSAFPGRFQHICAHLMIVDAYKEGSDSKPMYVASWAISPHRYMADSES